MKILRVFPKRTVLIPMDKMVRIGTQTQSLPPHDEIHISCTFTWDIDYCEYLREQYQAVSAPQMQLFKGCVNTIAFCLTRPGFEAFKTALGTEQVYIKNGTDGTSYILEDSAGDIMFADKLLLGYEYRIKFGNNGPGGIAHFLNLNTPCCARGYAPAGLIVEED